ncbi:MAG: hypothetical protein GY737_23940 [Desulfobacteraceae bacterium]|nr:hypothetical protein [Desulfobacteraceae bacterium]
MAVKLILGIFVALQITGLCFAAYKAKPLYLKLTNGHLILKQQIKLDVNTRLPITSSIDKTLDIPIKKRVNVNLPIRGDIDVSIDEPFEIPVLNSVNVALDHGFRIKKEITVNTDLPIDQFVETTILGVTANIPIRGRFPVDITVPLDETVRINDSFPLRITEPLTCQVSHNLTIPIDITAKAQFLIDQVIPVPINAEISTGIRLTGELPCFLYLDIFLDKERGLVIDHSVKVE